MDQDQPDNIFEINLGRYKGNTLHYTVGFENLKKCNLGKLYYLPKKLKLFIALFLNL